MKKALILMAMCLALFACVKKEAHRNPFTKDAIAGTWKIEEYAETVNHSDGTIEISDLTERVKNSSYTYFFYSDGQGFERGVNGKYKRITFSFNGNKLVISYGEDSVLRFEIKLLLDDNLFMETTETKGGEKFTASASFKRIHPGVITFNDLVGQWQVGDVLWSISEDGKCKLNDTNYIISLDAHRITLTKPADTSTPPYCYDILCFGDNDIRLFGEDASEPVQMTRVK